MRQTLEKIQSVKVQEKIEVADINGFFSSLKT